MPARLTPEDAARLRALRKELAANMDRMREQRDAMNAEIEAIERDVAEIDRELASRAGAAEGDGHRGH